MDVEKTIQFIVDTQARTEATLAKSAQWQAKVERKQDATIKLIKTGLKILAKHDNSIKALAHSVSETRRSVEDLRFSHQALIDAQMRTDEKLNRFIENLSKRRSNGR